MGRTVAEEHGEGQNHGRGGRWLRVRMGMALRRRRDEVEGLGRLGTLRWIYWWRKGEGRSSALREFERRPATGTVTMGETERSLS